ncbi:hypothetical protein BaOVIS_029420 [Babesia ovis]|uniref:Uncharacterized protein n=1 Tax=Babesia ovis TaxID=5869 RepID=A0A9W5TD00_BABOV|nr:hypothetical protein BaOVIS_029420 [Babesia ovis]
MKLRKNRLQILRKLALYATKSPVEVKLDRFWGFKPENPNRRKAKRRSRARASEKPSSCNNDVNKIFETVDNGSEPEEPSGNEVNQQSQPVPVPSRRKPWEVDPEVKKQKQVFKDAVKDLHKLVYPHLDPIAKRQYDNAKLLALGGKVAKNRKMPYKEFLQRTQALKRHVEKNQKLEKELGVKCFLDTKGGSRFVDIQKRKQKKELKETRSPFQFGDKNGVFHIKKLL